MIEQREELPKCFGKAWDDRAAACAGGLDPTYKDPETGSHIRERCIFFTTCGARVQAGRMQQLIPQNQLVRPPALPPVQTLAAPNQAAQLAQLMKQLEAMQQIIHQQNLQLANRHGMSTNPLQPMLPTQMMAVEYRMPGYLSVPEPRTKTASVWTVLSREIARSMFKSAGHTLANFWDTTPLGKAEE